MVDWGTIPDRHLAQVCAAARRRALKREKWNMATSADVLAVWHDHCEKLHRTAHQREEARLQAAIASGTILAEPTLATASDATRNEALIAMYRAAGTPIPGHLLSSQPVGDKEIP